jgi:arylformamidase
MEKSDPKVWLDYTQSELDDQYNQSSKVSNIPEVLERSLSESARVRNKLECELDVPYGPSPEEKLDIFPAPQRNAPVVMFIHGGAWNRTTKETVSYPAESFVAAGATYIAVDFALVPNVSLDELVRQNRAAIAWVYQNARSFGADPDKLFVAGHSSGAHVTGLMVVTDWQQWDAPTNLIKGALAASGMYDLEPIRLSARNEYLKLDEAAALRNGAIHHILDQMPPMVIGYGEGELDEFRRQSQAFAAQLRARGQVHQEFDLLGMNHFDVGFDFNNPEGRLLNAFFEVMQLA